MKKDRKVLPLGQWLGSLEEAWRILSAEGGFVRIRNERLERTHSLWMRDKITGYIYQMRRSGWTSVVTAMTQKNWHHPFANPVNYQLININKRKPDRYSNSTISHYRKVYDCGDQSYRVMVHSRIVRARRKGKKNVRHG